MLTRILTTELQVKSKTSRTVETSLVAAKASTSSRGGKKKLSVRKKSENKKSSFKKFAKKPSLRPKTPKWAVWNESKIAKIPNERKFKAHKSKREGLFNSPRSGYRYNPYKPKKIPKAGPYLQRRRRFKLRATVKHRQSVMLHEIRWAVRRKAFVLRYAQPRLRSLVIPRFGKFGIGSRISPTTPNLKIYNQRLNMLSSHTPRLFGRHFITTSSGRSWTYNRLQSKLRLKRGVFTHWGTLPTHTSLTSARQWLNNRYRRAFGFNNRLSVTRPHAKTLRLRSEEKSRQLKELSTWQRAQAAGWRRYKWRRNFRNAWVVGREDRTSKTSVNMSRRQEEQLYSFRPRFWRKKREKYRALPPRSPHSSTFSNLLLTRKLRTGRSRFRTESWLKSERTRFFGRWRKKHHRQNFLGSFRSTLLTGQKNRALIRERRQNLLEYTKTTSAKPVVNYKIIRLKGRKGVLNKKRALGHVLRFTRKMRGLLPAFKLAGSRNENPYGSLEYLPSVSKGLFLFTKKTLHLTKNAVFTPMAGYFAPVLKGFQSSTHLYLISYFAQTLYQTINLFQASYFQDFSLQWDLLNQLSWIDFNHIIAPAKSRHLLLRHTRFSTKSHFLLSPKGFTPATKKKEIHRVHKGKKRLRQFLPNFTIPEKRRSSKLYQKFLRNGRASRLKLKVLARAANAVNLAGRSRTLAYLKGALQFQKKRKFLGYEIEHKELFERDLIVVNYRYKAYSAFECFYNHRRDFRRLYSLSDSTSIYRNDDRFENSFTRWTLRNHITTPGFNRGGLLDLLYTAKLNSYSQAKPIRKPLLERRLAGKARRVKPRIFHLGRKRRWLRRYQMRSYRDRGDLLLKSRIQRRRLSRRYLSPKLTRSGFGVHRQPIFTTKHLPLYTNRQHFATKANTPTLNGSGLGFSFGNSEPRTNTYFNTNRSGLLRSQYYDLTQNIFFLRKIVTNSSLYKYTLMKLPNSTRSVTPKAYSLDTLDGLYFGSRAEQLKTSNVWYSPNFSYTMRRRVLKLFSFSSFHVNVTMWYYNNLVRFMQNCTGRKVWLTLYSNIENELSFSDRARCNLWERRLSGFQRLLGPKIFLKESLRVMHLVVSLKDAALLLNWIKVMLSKMSFWKYRLLFRYIKFVMRYFFWPHFKTLGFRGLKLKLKGKISVAGNARTRTLRYSIGENSHATLDNRVSHEISTIGTFTGVLGFQVWVFY